MSTFVPVQTKDLSWRCTEGYQTESQIVLLFLPQGGFISLNVAFGKISFVTIVKTALFYSVNNGSKLAVNACSKFQVNKDTMGMTCEEMTMEWKDDKLIIDLKDKELGAQGIFELKFNNKNSYQLDPAGYKEETCHYMITEPLQVSGQLQINNQDVNLTDTTGYFLHITYPGRFDGAFVQSYIALFNSPSHKIITIMHQPRSPADSPLVQQIYMHTTTTKCTTSAEFKFHEQFEDSQYKHTLPKSFTLDFPEDSWSIDATNLKSQARIDALEQIPYVARKIVSKILPSPCFYIHYTDATLKTKDSQVQGQLYFEKAQF